MILNMGEVARACAVLCIQFGLLGRQEQLFRTQPQLRNTVYRERFALHATEDMHALM